MSRPEPSRAFPDLAGELSAVLNDAVDARRVEDLDNETLGQLFAAIVRVYAQKVQNGENPRPHGRNSQFCATDAAIACTALMDAVNLELFELGGWQTMSGLGRLDREPARQGQPAPTDRTP